MDDQSSNYGAVGESSVWGRVARAGAAFLARRHSDSATVRSGDRVVIQTAEAGQVEALVMGRNDSGELLIRTARWSPTLAIPADSILRRLSREAA